MRWFGLSLLLLVMASPAPAGKSLSALDAAKECTAMADRLERLSCFDAVFGTPIHRQTGSARLPRHQPSIWLAAHAQQSGRRVADGAVYHQGEVGHLVTLAALGSQPPRPILAVQCENNISRLALMMPKPMRAERVGLSLNADERIQRQTWRVRGDGFVLSAGRGLPAIETIQGFLPAKRLELGSEVASVDGLVFDLNGLARALAPLRRDCGW